MEQARKTRRWDFDMMQQYLRHRFLFEELVKRDFKKKYKRTVLGAVWSLLSPLLMLLVMKLVFTQFFGRTMEHYTIYLFCGNLVFSYFNESTSQGMTSLVNNAAIFTKVNIPKYLFLFSKNVQTLINFSLTLCIFFVFCGLDHILFTWKFLLLLYPVCLLVLFNIGVGLILSALCSSGTSSTSGASLPRSCCTPPRSSTPSTTMTTRCSACSSSTRYTSLSATSGRSSLTARFRQCGFTC